MQGRMTKTLAIVTLGVALTSCSSDPAPADTPTGGNTPSTTVTTSADPATTTVAPASATATTPTPASTTTTAPTTPAATTPPAKNDPPFPLPDNAKGDDAQLWAAVSKVLPASADKDKDFITAYLGPEVCATFADAKDFDDVVERYSAGYAKDYGMSTKREDAVWLVVAGSRHSCPEHAQKWAAAQGFDLAPDAKPAPTTRPPRVWPKITIPNAWPTKPMPREQFTTLLNDVYGFTTEEQWSYQMYENMGSMMCGTMEMRKDDPKALAKMFTDNLNGTIETRKALDPQDTFDRTRIGYAEGLIGIQFCPDLAHAGWLPNTPQSIR